MDENKFVIGKYEFDSFHEYRDGEEDIRKIELIKSELDIKDPKVAVRLYNMMRSGEITFKSKIGEDFFYHISDTVADKSIDLIADQVDEERVEKKYRFQKVAAAGLVGLAVVAFGYVAYVEVRDYLNTKRLAQIQQEAQVVHSTEGLTPEQYLAKKELEEQLAAIEAENQTQQTETVPQAAQPQWIDRATLEVLPQFEELYMQNGDLAGWLEIPETDIYYPVMQAAGDNDYYLEHDFYGNADSNGSIFVDYRCDIVNQPMNTIVYGHNMKSGKMFGTLKKYLEDGYLETHPLIFFDTIFEERAYQIVAVCLSKVSYQDEEEFRYYNFISANSANEVNAFLDNVEALAVVRTTESIGAGDHLLTLSTCNSYTDDGRLFIVAKRIE